MPRLPAQAAVAEAAALPRLTVGEVFTAPALRRPLALVFGLAIFQQARSASVYMLKIPMQIQQCYIMQTQEDSNYRGAIF